MFVSLLADRGDKVKGLVLLATVAVLIMQPVRDTNTTTTNWQYERHHKMLL